MRRADILGVVLSYQDEVMLVGKEEGHHFGLSQAVRHLLLCCDRPAVDWTWRYVT